MNYENAMNFMKGRLVKKLKNNTYLHRLEDGCIGVKLHSTFIIKMYPIGMTLNSGGWRTPITKDRLNMFVGNAIAQRKGLWYFNDHLFYDGIEVDYENNILSEKKELELDKVRQMNRKKKEIREFCNLLDNYGDIPLPDAGDCWYCGLRTDSGSNLGDSVNSHGHLWSHIEEGCMNGSLIYNALKEEGRLDEGIVMIIRMKLVPTVKRALYKYLCKRLVRY